MNEQIIYNNIISRFYDKLANNDIEDNGTIEIINSSIELDPTYIIEFNGKKTNVDYCKKELNWYLSQSLSITDYVDDVKIWNDVCSKDDKKEVNSNYGYLVFSNENYSQFNNCKNHLINDKSSRNGIIIYSRPSIHYDMHENGKHDMICTMYVQFFIRNDKLIMINNMRSNDFVFGFFNDFYWACYLYDKMFNELNSVYKNLKKNKIIWNVNSLHVYPRHFELIKKLYNNN